MNNNKRFTLAGALALFAVIGTFSAQPLSAQARPAAVKNVDERGRTPYMVTVPCLITKTICISTFPQVPANMRLVVEHVNALAVAETALEYLALSSSDDSTFNLAKFPFMQKMSTNSSGSSLYVGNQPLLIYFEAGQAPTLVIFGTGNVSGQVTLSGYLVNLNQ